MLQKPFTLISCERITNHTEPARVPNEAITVYSTVRRSRSDL